MKKLFLIFLAVTSLAVCAVAQTRTVKGVVLYQGDDDPLVGATIMPVGGGTPTATDIEGRFTLNIPQSVKKLTVSYVGMKPKQVDITSDDMIIWMSNSDNALDEVVVTAFGMKKERKGLGYAVQDLKAEDLNTDGTTSLASAMQGKLTGVDIRPSSGAPGASNQIVIRGARSFDGNNQPLYVVDGMPIESTADYSTGNSTSGANIADRSIDINPDDIESVNVLKGQAASALYGIRASNGVIVITTKRGRLNSSKPTITLSTNLSAEIVSRKFQRQDIYAQGNTLSSYSPNSSMTWGPKISELPNDPTYGGNANGHPGMYRNPKLAAAGLDEWTTPQVYDNVGDFFNTGFTENTNFSIAQRTDRASYSFGLNNSYQNGIIPSTGMNRWSARGLVDWTIDNEWKTGFSANYSSTKITSAPGANDGVMNVVYSAPSEYNLKGIPYHAPDVPTQQILFRTTSFNNPYWWAENNEYLQHTNRFFGNAYVEYHPNINWGDNYDLTIREQAGLDVYTSNYSDVVEQGAATSSGFNYGNIENYGVSRNVFNNLLTISFNALWGADREWDFSAMLGNEINQDNARYWDYYGANFNFYGMPTIGNATNYQSSEYNAKDRTVGFFGSLSLSWKSMLFLTVTGRNDYVSTMPRNNRSFFYPSVSLGWVFTELEALKGNNILSFGKLRASYAQVGQAGTYRKNYYYTPSYGSGMYASGYYPVSYPLNGISTYTPYYVVFDPDLTPQNTENIEFGVDARLFNDRIRLEYTASYQNVTDQIFDVPTAGSIGYQYMRTNAGKMQTWSHELGINASILQGRDYDLNLGINFTKVKNKVVELARGVESIMLGGFVEPQIRAQAGNTYPNIYGVAFKRNGDGQLLLQDGLPQGTADSQDLGNCSPDFVMGFNLSGRYKRVSLSTTWSWNKGGRMYHGTNMTLNYFGATKESIPYHEGTMVAQGIDEATGLANTIEVSKQDYYMAYYDVTEAGVYDMSFFKLRDVTLTYKLPTIWKLDIDVFAFARNVLLWSKLPNFDPESSQGNTNMGGYFERFSVPNTTSIGGGLKVTF
ncbi:MAG: SusC/RagA family TonB-linked outer membrane protein [Muribaculaceae bacterium]